MNALWAQVGRAVAEPRLLAREIVAISRTLAGRRIVAYHERPVTEDQSRIDEPL